MLPRIGRRPILRVMTLLGFVQGRSNSCLYFHPGRQIQVEVHGDDFTGLGSKDHLEWFATELGKHWTIEVRGYLGPPGMAGTQQTIDILNRLVTWGAKGIELEADPRHAEIIMNEMGCAGAKVSSALVKERVEEVDSAEPLDPEEIPRYRSVSMRLAYLAQDRPGLAGTCQGVGKGTEESHYCTLDNAQERSTVPEKQTSSDSSLPVSAFYISIGGLDRCGPCWMFENTEKHHWLLHSTWKIHYENQLQEPGSNCT